MNLAERYEELLSPDTLYCKYHPRIQEKNKQQIKLKMGSVKEKHGQIKNFKFCPKCLRAQQNEKTRQLNYL